jgi:hypothetical protein
VRCCPAPSLKNKSLSPAADELLGLGDQLQLQVGNQLDQQRKLKTGSINPNTPGLSPAVSSLLGLTGGM